MTSQLATPPLLTWFAERREVVRAARRGASSDVPEITRLRGLARTRHHHLGSRHDWVSLGPASDAPAGLPDGFTEQVRTFSAPWPSDVYALELLEGVLGRVGEFCAGRGLTDAEAAARSFVQQVAISDGDSVATDVRRYTTIGMSTRVPGASLSVRRESAFRDLDDLERGCESVCARLADAVQTLEQAGPPRDVPPARLPVVLAPGACAQFFHELCGHPLEADVVASGTSYLGWRQRAAVAPEFLSIVDDPSSPAAFAGYSIDDEGVPAEPVPLVDAGRVSGRLYDLDLAAADGRPSNGHGRRLNYLYPAVPRQCHTRVLPHAGDEASLVASLREGLLVRRLRLRHMNVASGSFSFYVDEGHCIAGGSLDHPLAGVVVSGDGLGALASIDAVGADSAHFMAGGGCGKLDQGPLIVSFEQPSVRLRSLDVHTERIHVGH